MNINSYNPIKSINVEAPMTNVRYGEGTYKALLEKVLDGTIDALVTNSGEIVGINYNSGKVGAEDSIAQMIFERQYAGKDVMSAVLLGFELKAHRASILSVEEDGNYARVTTEDGEIHEIGHKDEPHTSSRDYDLPSEVELDLWDDLDGETSLSAVRNYLKGEYGHCLARGIQPDIYEEDGTVYVSNIEWGRPLSQSELDAIL